MTLLQAMKERGIAREHLAAALGVPAERVGAWLDGTKRIHPAYFGELRRLMGMSRREFDAQRRTPTNRVVSADKSRRRFPASLMFACTGAMRIQVLNEAARRETTPSALLREIVNEFLQGGADAGCQQCTGRKIPRRMRPTSTRLPQSPDKAQARPVSTVKGLHPRRPFSKTTNPKQGDHK